MKKGDKVITSRGNFAIIEDINGNIAKLQIGKNLIDVNVNQIVPLDNVKSIKVEYTLSSDIMRTNILSDVIFLHKRIQLFNFDNPMDNSLFLQIKEQLTKKINNDNINILTIYLI